MIHLIIDTLRPSEGIRFTAVSKPQNPPQIYRNMIQRTIDTFSPSGEIRFTEVSMIKAPGTAAILTVISKPVQELRKASMHLPIYLFNSKWTFDILC